jgi:hypothetical protein
MNRKGPSTLLVLVLVLARLVLVGRLVWLLLVFVNHRQIGRAIAQAVSRRLPTAAARVQTRVWSCGIL